MRAKEGQRRSFSRLCQDTLPSSWRLRSWASCCLCPLRMVYRLHTNCLSVSIVTSESSTLFPRALRPLLLVSGHERPLPSSCVMVMVLCYGCKHDDDDATDCAVQLTAMSDSRSRKKRFVSSLPRPRSLAFAHSLSPVCQSMWWRPRPPEGRATLVTKTASHARAGHHIRHNAAEAFFACSPTTCSLWTLHARAGRGLRLAFHHFSRLPSLLSTIAVPPL